MTAAWGLAALAITFEPPTQPVRVERVAPMMGTVLELLVEAPDRRRALEASERAIRALEAAEARLSTWREDSELSRLNRAPVGEPVGLSPELGAELGAAMRCSRETRGAFDPGIGALLDAWGARTGGRLPSEAEVAGARAGGGIAALALERGAVFPISLRMRRGTGRTGGSGVTEPWPYVVEPETGRLGAAYRSPEGPAVGAARAGAAGGVWATRLHPGLRLEEGAWGKGAGLDRAVEALAAGDRPVRALLNLGGQVSVAGEGPAWEVEVADPGRRDRPVLKLSVSAGSIATSGGGERGLSVDGERLSHIFDPRTGRPAPDFGTLTVVAPDGLTADCLSTGLYVLGPQAALAWAAERPGIEVLTLEPRGEGLLARMTAGLAGRVDVLEEEVTLAVFARSPAGDRIMKREQQGASTFPSRAPRRSP
jgi:thiamine biosynthesis lipoprotein